MKSRLLGRLESDIRGAPSELAADCLRCERAAYLARRGDSEEAACELAAVRERYSARPNAAISAWASLADGLIDHYCNLGPHARDKLARANALSAATGLKSIQALSAAWLAHLEYLRMDVPALAKRAAEALSLAQADHHAALARAKLVVAQSYDEGGRHDLARPWYDQARRHAAADGDDATLSAMMWNMAALRVATWRQIEACGPAAHEDAGRHALLSAQSAAHFDDMTGMRSLPALQPILQAQICVLLGQPGEALALYEAHFAAAIEQGMGSIEGVLLADRAWCLLKLGRTEAARADAAAAASSLSTPGSCCDRAPGHSRLAQVCDGLGDLTDAERQRELAAHAWAGHRRDQARLVDVLNLTFECTPA